MNYRNHITDNAEVIHLYQKIKKNSWKFKGFYRLIDAKKEKSNGRYVFKFILILENIDTISEKEIEGDQQREIKEAISRIKEEGVEK